MSDNEIRQLIAKLNWVFAKTYADKSPHKYTAVMAGSKYRDEVLRPMHQIFTNGELEMLHDTIYGF